MVQHSPATDPKADAMSGYQWLIVALCLLLNAQDGFDISAVAYASTGITEEWGLSGTQLGLVISTGLVGIVVGAFVLSPLADRIGRKNTVLIGLALTAVGMAGVAIARSTVELTLWRLLTGIGVGGVTSCINVIASEYSSRKLRGMSIGLYTAGFGVGASLGGLGAAALLDAHGWRSIFVVGAIVSVVVLVIMAVLLPESIDYLVARRPRRALQRINSIGRRIGRAPLDQLPSRSSEQRTPALRQQIGELFSAQLRRRTLLLWAGFFASMFAFYFLTGWTPRLVVLAGSTQQHSAVVGLMLSIGGSVGAIAFGLISVATGAQRLVMVFGVAGAGTFLLLGATLAAVPAGLIVAFVAGLLANGAIVGLFTMAPALYPPLIRATGVGWANGVGRSGSIIAPLVAGAMVDGGWRGIALYGFAAVFLLLLTGIAMAYRRADSTGGPSSPAIAAGQPTLQKGMTA